MGRGAAFKIKLRSCGQKTALKYGSRGFFSSPKGSLPFQETLDILKANIQGYQMSPTGA